MMTGYIATCPHCKKQTSIKAHRTNDKTQIHDLPNWEKDNCIHCKKPIYITVDVRVVETSKAPEK